MAIPPFRRNPICEPAAAIAARESREQGDGADHDPSGEFAHMLFSFEQFLGPGCKRTQHESQRRVTGRRQQPVTRRQDSPACAQPWLRSGGRLRRAKFSCSALRFAQLPEKTCGD